jgi:hypothetical protein
MNEKEARDKAEREIQEHHYYKNLYNLSLRKPKKSKQERKAKWAAFTMTKKDQP